MINYFTSKNLKCLFILLFISNAVSAQNYSKPESVDFDTAGNKYFISNLNSGRIQVRSNDGNLNSLTTNAISPAPYGLEFCNGKLYACCGGLVKVFNPATGALLNNITVNTGSTFLNGIAHDTANNVYVTDFTAKKIFKIDENNNVSTLISNTVNTPNGIIYEEENNRLVYVCWGSNAKIKSVSLVTLNDSTLTTTNLSNIDGIARDNEGNYYVSNWGGQSVVKFLPDFSASQTVVTSLNSPADIYYNLETDTLAIPNSVNSGGVTFWHNQDVTTHTDNFKNQTFKVFPNPAMQQFQIDLSSSNNRYINLEVLNTEGKTVFSQTINSSEKMIAIQVQNLAPGLYILKLNSNNHSFDTTRLIVN